jgi:hypothetical protein
LQEFSFKYDPIIGKPFQEHLFSSHFGAESRLDRRMQVTSFAHHSEYCENNLAKSMRGAQIGTSVKRPLAPVNISDCYLGSTGQGAASGRSAWSRPELRSCSFGSNESSIALRPGLWHAILGLGDK